MLKRFTMALLLIAAMLPLASAQQNICQQCGQDYQYSFTTCYQIQGLDCPRHSGCLDQQFVTVVCENRYTGQYCGGTTGACCPGPCDATRKRVTDGLNGSTSCLFDPKKDDVKKLKVLEVYHDVEVKGGKITKMEPSIQDEIDAWKLHIADSGAARKAGR